MNSTTMRRRARWLEGVAARLDPGHARPLHRYAGKLARIADTIDREPRRRVELLA